MSDLGEDELRQTFCSVVSGSADVGEEDVDHFLSLVRGSNELASNKRAHIAGLEFWNMVGAVSDEAGNFIGVDVKDKLDLPASSHTVTPRWPTYPFSACSRNPRI